MSIRNRVALHVAVGEMIYSTKLNEAYMALANGRRASSRLEKAVWLANHVDFRKTQEYITFKLVWICSNCGKPIYWGFSDHKDGSFDQLSYNSVSYCAS